jgi:hypothetical protein
MRKATVLAHLHQAVAAGLVLRERRRFRLAVEPPKSREPIPVPLSPEQWLLLEMAAQCREGSRSQLAEAIAKVLSVLRGEEVRS